MKKQVKVDEILKLTPYQRRALSVVNWFIDDYKISNIKNPHLDPKYAKVAKDLCGSVGTGKSTLLAFAYIRYAMRNPGVWVYPIDIPGASHSPNYPAKERFVYSIAIMWRDKFAPHFPELVMVSNAARMSFKVDYQTNV